MYPFCSPYTQVIGLAGTDEKCKWVESLGADLCLNYKAATFWDDLVQATPQFVDVFFGTFLLGILIFLADNPSRQCGRNDPGLDAEANGQIRPHRRLRYYLKLQPRCRRHRPKELLCERYHICDPEGN